VLKRLKRGDWTSDRLDRRAFGLEAELTLILDDAPADPAAVFGSPQGFIDVPLMHRIGTSYHLPNGAAVYFDTGVIEIATPAMELERGCVSRATRSLWEGIDIVRDHLDRWGAAHGRRVRLQGFSTHYNVSVGDDRAAVGAVARLARALVYVLPAPVMVLATNRRSTGVGVRPRFGRIEVTADFTPDPRLTVAAGTLIAGVVDEMGAWPAGALRRLPNLPVMRQFAPVRHTSRRGWLANIGCYAESPFACDLDTTRWPTAQGPLSLREIARRVFGRFERAIGRVGERSALRAIRSILNGRGTSLLSLADRPPSYDDVGRGVDWSSMADSPLARSRYERVVQNAVQGRPLGLAGDRCTPVAVRGWSRVLFRRDRDGARLTLPFDVLIERLGEWEQG
jgi:hypothetical protein